MATHITLRDVPESLHAWLKAEAREHHRSLNREIVAQLETLRQGGRPSAPTRDARVEDLLELGRKIANLPTRTYSHEDEILNYDPETGIPR